MRSRGPFASLLASFAGCALLSLVACPPADVLGTSRFDAEPGDDPEPDASIDEPDAPPARTCAPRGDVDVTPFFSPPRARAAVCDRAVRTQLAMCFASEKPSRCEAELAAVPEACRACVLSPASAPSWGAIVRYEDGIYVANQAGCWEASAEVADGGEGCAPAIQRRVDCQMRGVCGDCTDPLPHELRACFEASIAEGGACAGVLASEQACTFPVATGGGRAIFDRCIQTRYEMPAAYWLGILDLFCGEL